MPQDFATARPVGHLRLHLGTAGSARSLSAIEQVGNTLFLGADERAALDCVSSDDYVGFDRHQSLPLSAYFDLPGGKDGEADIEGLGIDRARRRLWIAGSHSLRRRKPRDGDSGHEAGKALRHLDRQPNRFLLGYVSLDLDLDGNPAPARTGHAALPMTRDSSRLVELLVDDPLLTPFLALPSKDNGFDIEGLAVDGDRVFLGLRGPVLRGWATLLQLTLTDAGHGRLEPQPLGPGRAYLRHLLDLGGLGIRDLCVIDRDLLILAGPTMLLDGPLRLFRWHDALRVTDDQRVDGSGLQLLFDIPSGIRSDHAEGIALFNAPGQPTRLVVVYDSPALSRLHDGTYFEADLFAI